MGRLSASFGLFSLALGQMPGLAPWADICSQLAGCVRRNDLVRGRGESFPLGIVFALARYRAFGFGVHNGMMVTAMRIATPADINNMICRHSEESNSSTGIAVSRPRSSAPLGATNPRRIWWSREESDQEAQSIACNGRVESRI